jgi:hypothetical protein
MVTTIKHLILNIDASSAEEMAKHMKGPGTGYVFLDHSDKPDDNIYVAMRRVENVDHPARHVVTSTTLKTYSSPRGSIRIYLDWRWNFCWAIPCIISNPPRP